MQEANQFLWVKPDELDKQIRARAHAKFGITRSEKKASGSRPKKTPVVIDPAQLQLVPDLFVDENGHAVTQIDMQKVATDRAGLAFGTIQDVAPFVAEGRPLTMDALGVLTTMPIPVHQQGMLPVQNLRYPCILGDHTLAELEVSLAYLVQQGMLPAPSPQQHQSPIP